MVVKSVLGIVFKEEQVLMIKRRDVPVWVFPGGGMNEKEVGEEAIVREILEETGLKVRAVRRIGTYTGGKFIKPVHVYECRPIEGCPRAGDEVKAVQYFSLHGLPKEIPPPFPEFLEDALKQLPPFERKITSITAFTVIRMGFRYPLCFLRFLLSRIGLHINT